MSLVRLVGCLSYVPASTDADILVGQFDMRKGALYIVPADFWDYVRLDSGVSDDEKMET